jgi:broad specificity phosphatase PhoE
MIVFLRHAESIQNRAHAALLEGDSSHFTDEYLQTKDPEVSLTEEGLRQAAATGEWLRKEFPDGFASCICSPYRRALQTFAQLGLPNQPVIEPRIREQSWGSLHHKHPHTAAEERREYFERFQTAMDARPGDGESVREHFHRVREFLTELLAGYSGEDILIVSHGGSMKMARMILENIPEHELSRLYTPEFPMSNCQLVMYSEKDPVTGSLEESLCWVNSLCPQKPYGQTPDWRKF